VTDSNARLNKPILLIENGAPRVALTGFAFKSNAAPHDVGIGKSELSSSAVAKPRAHADEALSVGRVASGSTEAKEGMMLDSALPQMLASFFVGHLEHESMLLLITLQRKCVKYGK
jgi:hypothetical protein